MKSGEGSPYSSDWQKVAKHDWHRMLILLKDGDPEGASFFLQQSIEKFLKAYLLLKGWKLKKIHTLQTLLDEAAAFDAKLKSSRPLCERISAFYLADRYPTLGESQLDADDIREELTEAKSLIKHLFPEQVLES